jgi:dihydrofolate reductase
MRKLIVTENITLDGVMSDPDLSYQSDDQIAINKAHMDAADALLLGRKTYDEFVSFWPYQKDDPAGVASYINAVAKYVVSSTLDNAIWNNTTILRGDTADEVMQLKRQDGKDIVVTGSGELVRSLLAARLVDEYRLFVAPVVRGSGTRLFPGGFDATLQLVEARGFDSGVVLLRYRPAPTA